jgi:exodeoxyribonuclease-3
MWNIQEGNVKTLRLLSWNVNGIRAILKKGFLDWLRRADCDILCVQETKADDQHIPDELKQIAGFSFHHVAASKKGYSGVALFSRPTIKTIQKGFGVKRFDIEGRTLIADYGTFVLVNVYFPNGKMSKERLQYKLGFYNAFLEYIDGLKAQGTHLIICGDVNTAHQEIDLARPKENEKKSGFLPEERAWIDTLIDHGYIDTFRFFHRETGHYTWWDYRTKARDRDIGWRIDCFYVSKDLKKNLKSAFILKDVTGSDHCPIGIELKI